MPYNAFGDLYKSEIVIRLRELGCNVANVHHLNVIMAGMGLLERTTRGWVTTDIGVQYTIYRGRCDADAWHPSVVGDIYQFLSN